MAKQSAAIGRILRYRNKLGISQDQLEKRADLAFNTIAKIEAGAMPNPTIDTVQKTCPVVTEPACSEFVESIEVYCWGCRRA